jgi:hypothetical protein
MPNIKVEEKDFYYSPDPSEDETFVHNLNWGQQSDLNDSVLELMNILISAPPEGKLPELNLG